MYKEIINKRFSIEEAAVIRDKTYTQLEAGEKEFILDFRNCEFIDSTGLGFLVGLYKNCQEHNADMILQNLDGRVYKVFEMTRLTNVFTIV